MAAGGMRAKLRFERRGYADDGAGNAGEAGPFEAQFFRHARLVPLKGGESVIAQRLAGIQPVAVEIRSDSDTRTITTSWRAVDARSGAAYDIRSIADMKQKGAWLTLLCETGVPSGS